MDVLYTILIVLGSTLAAIGLSFAARYALNFIRLKLGKEQMAALKGFAELVIRALEQSGTKFNFTGAEKKAYALVAIRAFAKKYNIELDDDLLESLIEAAVQIMNEGFGKFFYEEPSG